MTHGTLVPDHQLQRVRRSLLYRETKTEASDAWLPVPDIVAATLMIRRTQQDREREAAGEIWQQTKDMPSLIFTGRYGTPVDPRTLNRKFTARCEAAGVRPITVHDARHTCATLLVDLEVHPRVIMRILRHLTRRSRWRYIWKCQFGGHARGAAATWRDPALRSLLYFAAVLAARRLQSRIQVCA